MARASWFAGGTLKMEKKHRKRPRGKNLRTIYGLDDDADRISAGVAASYVDPEEERDPPPPATPVTFPAYNYETVSEHGQGILPVDASLQSLFAKVLKPTDVTDQHVHALGIETCQPCTLEVLLRRATHGTSYLPPLDPDCLISIASGADTPMTTAEVLASRRRMALDERLAELQVDNNAAYRTLSRNLKDGTKGRRLAYMRKFFEGLESMSRYWDSRLDQYYEIPAELSGKGVKRPRLDKKVHSSTMDTCSTSAATSDSSCSVGKLPLLPTPAPSPDRDSSPAAQKQHSDQTTTSSAEADNGTCSANPKSATEPQPGTRSETVSPEPRSPHRYKGRRLHTGREMPDQFRINTVRAFFEATTMPFQCSVAPPRVKPFVQVGILSLPVGQTAAIYRQPSDRTKARQGRLEGPMVTLQVRAETEFEDKIGQPLAAKGRLHHVRELSGLLQIAQERRRSGAEIKPGEGKWWTSKPRWGGGPEREPETGVEPPADDKSNSKALNYDKRIQATLAQRWKDVKCGRGSWDPKTDYAAIGKDPTSRYDEVFMVSSLNHHVSIVKLTVHGAYTDTLLSGAPLDSIPAASDWARPKLQRSQWFDLFDEQQRVEAFRGLWGVMAYLTRETGEGATCGEPAAAHVEGV